MKTKIIATLGPASNSKEVISELVTAGVRIFRLNFSHGDISAFASLISLLRDVEKEHQVPITILQDLSGPKIRIGTIQGEGTITVHKGQLLHLGPSDSHVHDTLPLVPFDHKTILASLEANDRLVLADGTLQFKIIAKEEQGTFLMEATSAGIITSRKGLALPGKSVHLPALTEKDRKDLIAGLELGVDAVALSYVQTPEDIREAKSILRANGKTIPVVAKLERRNAVERLDEILYEADIIMVARGDLGIECSLSELPAMQKRIIRACNAAAKPVIVATQMLLSMVSNPSPTRAETTDVANAVLDGTDCVMLSEETAMGAFPVETVHFMNEITTEAERFMAEVKHHLEPEKEAGPAEFLAYGACLLAEKTKAKALVAHSLSGLSARRLSALKPEQIIYAITPDETALHTLNFSWGITPCHMPEGGGTHLQRVEHFISMNPQFALGDDVIVTAGQPSNATDAPRGTNLVKIYRK